MNKKLRYFLIFLCLLVFVIAAPLIVLFVSGTKLDLRSKDYTKTGILVAFSNPDKAEVYLNGESKGDTPANIRFLNQGDYKLTLKKPGYYDWSKTLSVQPDRITYNYEGVDAVQLIMKPNPSALPLPAVNSFVLVGGEIWYASGNNIGRFKINDPSAETKNITLSFNPSRLENTSDDNFLLVTGQAGRQAILDIDKKTAVELPAGMSGSKSITVSPDGQILAIKDGNLYAYQSQTNTTKLVLGNVTGFTMLGNTGYLSRSASDGVIETRRWANSAFGEAQILASDSMLQQPTELIITKNKVLFVVNNGNLYRVNETLQLLNKQVKHIRIDSQTEELAYITPGELWFYNFLANKPQLLTRNTTAVNSFLMRSPIGYGFFSSPNGLEAWETDTRSEQNHYPIASNQNVGEIAVDKSIKNIYYLSGEKIYTTPLRE